MHSFTHIQCNVQEPPRGYQGSSIWFTGAFRTSRWSSSLQSRSIWLQYCRYTKYLVVFYLSYWKYYSSIDSASIFCFHILGVVFCCVKNLIHHPKGLQRHPVHEFFLRWKHLFTMWHFSNVVSVKLCFLKELASYNTLVTWFGFITVIFHALLNSLKVKYRGLLRISFECGSCCFFMVCRVLYPYCLLFYLGDSCIYVILG